MIAAALRRLAAWVSTQAQRTHDVQLQVLDAAVARHMAHGAMIAGDPLTEIPLDLALDPLAAPDRQADTCAVEGAMPPERYSSSPAPVGMWDDERAHPWLYAALYGGTVALALLASHWFA